MKIDPASIHNDHVTIEDETPLLTEGAKPIVYADPIEERGAIYTKIEVVEFMLDLVGYTDDQPLFTYRLLEPAFGEGSFLLVAIKRLVTAWREQVTGDSIESLAGAITGIELHGDSWRHTGHKVKELLIREGLTLEQANRLTNQWLQQADFLLTDIQGPYDVVIGNPPYVRQERIPGPLMSEYRSRYQTIYDRADLYIPFFERSLRLLGSNGQLAFICTDRWMKNKYGGPLRKLVSDHFHLQYYVNMVGTDAFESEVSTYPAITVITKQKRRVTRTAIKPAVTKNALSLLSTALRSVEINQSNRLVEQLEGVTAGAAPWLLEAPEERALVRKLEKQFPTLEQTGCKVGIGVATGADSAFIGLFEQLNVEPDRKLPLVMTKDIADNIVAWRGLGVINPFAPDGTLVDLEKYPLLKAYLGNHQALIKKRHVAAKNPNNWYRTIDRIYPELVHMPKLLIPDIKGDAHIVYEEGKFYPHHNLYFITSTAWDLKALQLILQSGIARLFVSVYSTKMRGGYLRFQAQYLRKICLPQWKDIDDHTRKELLRASKENDVVSCNQAVGKLYGLTEPEMELLR